MSDDMVKRPTPPSGDLLDGMDDLPDGLQRFLCALVRGLRAEHRHPTRLDAIPIKEPDIWQHADGVWQYRIEYPDPTLQPPGPGKRYVSGEWK